VKKLILVLAAIVSSVTLVACGGGDDPAPAVVATNTDVATNANTAAAVANLPFVFPSGVPELGTTASTTLSFTNTATTPAFAIASGGMQAQGTTTFGSCIFVITQSTFPAGHRLALGQTITVNPCNIRANTAGKSNNGVAENRAVSLILGAALSQGVTVTINVNEGGQLTINGRDVGTVTLTPVTGS
jgi:hypothetical protein